MTWKKTCHDTDTDTDIATHQNVLPVKITSTFVVQLNLKGLSASHSHVIDNPLIVANLLPDPLILRNITYIIPVV